MDATSRMVAKVHAITHGCTIIHCQSDASCPSTTVCVNGYCQDGSRHLLATASLSRELGRRPASICHLEHEQRGLAFGSEPFIHELGALDERLEELGTAFLEPRASSDLEDDLLVGTHVDGRHPCFR